MEQERWTVLEHRGVERDEISWHYSPEKAKRVAQDHANRTGNTTTVDLNVGQLTRYGGWEVEDSDADLWSFTPSPATAESNANRDLIVQAPAMLEALTDLLDWYDRNEGDLHPLMNAARVVIAAAERD